MKPQGVDDESGRSGGGFSVVVSTGHVDVVGFEALR
jgi:hypothetical protein